MSSNLQRLGKVLDGRMKKTSGAAVKTTLEFGIINSNLSLTTDTLKTQIPKGDYMVDIRLACSTYRTSSEDNGDGGQQDHRLPEEFRALQAGDRVLVAWVGYEPVVISIIVSS